MFNANPDSIRYNNRPFHKGSYTSNGTQKGNFYYEWERITADSKILGIVRNGLSINFEYNPHKCSPNQYRRALEETSVIDKKIKKLLKNAIIPTTAEKPDFFSNIFARLQMRQI